MISNDHAAWPLQRLEALGRSGAAIQARAGPSSQQAIQLVSHPSHPSHPNHPNHPRAIQLIEPRSALLEIFGNQKLNSFFVCVGSSLVRAISLYLCIWMHLDAFRCIQMRSGMQNTCACVLGRCLARWAGWSMGCLTRCLVAEHRAPHYRHALAERSSRPRCSKRAYSSLEKMQKQFEVMIKKGAYAYT